MKAEEAKELACKTSDTATRYNEVMAKIKVLAEHGQFRLMTPYPGSEVMDMIYKDGYRCFELDGDKGLNVHISW